ncbi:cell envelope biogenesis protein TolA [Bartonella florencae]|uniref:cell envelope biogenesis protein TolA n=1 Tax=Bartonella florencae TaxID=928210 RepID=UPI00313778E0
MNKDSYHSMKRGLALSLVIHVIFLSWGAVTFINPVSLPQQLEVIPITLAPVDDELSSQKGAVDAPVQAIPAVKPTIKPQEKEDARYVGEGKIDSLMPFKEKEKPRLIETASSLSEQEETKTEPPLEVPEEKREAVAEKPLEVLGEKREAVAEKPREVPEETREAVAEKPREVPEETREAVAEKPREVPEEKREAVAEKPLEVSEEKREAVAEKPREVPEETREAVAEKPREVPEEKREAVAEKPREVLEETREAVAEKPLEVSEEKREAVAEKPLEVLGEKREAVAEKPLEVLGEKREAVAEKPLEVPEEKREAVAEKPREVSGEKREAVAEKPRENPLEVRKNEEVISPQKLAPMVNKVPVEQATKHSQERQIVLPEKPLLPQLKPKPAKDTKIQIAQAHNKKNQQMNHKTIEDILAMEENNLLNRARTQGGGAKRSSTQAALGAKKILTIPQKWHKHWSLLLGGVFNKSLNLWHLVVI